MYLVINSFQFLACVEYADLRMREREQCVSRGQGIVYICVVVGCFIRPAQ